MIIPDTSLLVYAYNKNARHHQASKKWFEQLVISGEEIAIPWIVSLSFLRLMTHRSVLQNPMSSAQSYGIVESWYEIENVRAIDAGPRSLRIMRGLVKEVSPSGNLFYDMYLASLALEFNAEVHSNDADFARFPGLRWRNPIG